MTSSTVRAKASAANRVVEGYCRSGYFSLGWKSSSSLFTTQPLLPPQEEEEEEEEDKESTKTTQPLLHSPPRQPTTSSYSSFFSTRKPTLLLQRRTIFSTNNNDDDNNHNSSSSSLFPPTPHAAKNNTWTKLSPHATPDSLFRECLTHLRTLQLTLDPDVDTLPSPTIQKLNADELEITRNIFKRVDQTVQSSSNESINKHTTTLPTTTTAPYIDPYWDPFIKIDKLKDQVNAEFHEYARLVTAAETRRQRMEIRRSLNRHEKANDPYSPFSRFNKQPTEPFPVPHRMHERYWNPDPDRRRILYNNNRPITWKDVHVLHHFIAENGMLLPRRATLATRRQHSAIVRAIRTARQLAMFPNDCKPTHRERVPLIDPYQYLCDELTQRYQSGGDLRAKAMVQTMMTNFPTLNYRRFLLYEASKKKRETEEKEQAKEEAEGDFSRILRKYKYVNHMTTIDTTSPGCSTIAV